MNDLLDAQHARRGFRALLLGVILGATLASCGDTAQQFHVMTESKHDWATSAGPVKLAINRRVVDSIHEVRATIINGSNMTIDWGGCVFVDRWPNSLQRRRGGLSTEEASCLAKSLVRPHSRILNAYIEPPGPMAPGFYRLRLSYDFPGQGLTELRNAYVGITLVHATR